MGIVSLPDWSHKQLRIGDIFTPPQWAEFAIEKFDIFQKWINGALVFDPTMGTANLLEALIIYGIKQGYAINELPTHCLFGNELNTHHFVKAQQKFEQRYQLFMHSNFTNEDLLHLPPKQYDIILGNPPWQNFVDLPDNYKQKIKHYFFKYDLVDNSRNLLLGGSRIDLAALIVQVAIKDFLAENGEAVFFLPLSLFLNDGANKSFRTYSIAEIKYALQCIYDFNDAAIFGGVATRYGLAHFIRNQHTTFPIPYFCLNEGVWANKVAQPMFHQTDPLSVMAEQDTVMFDSITPIVIDKESCPRQGINTCGANDIFIFDTLISVDEHTVSVSNKIFTDVLLPRQFVFPLIAAKNFGFHPLVPNKWVLLPYHSNGKALEWQQIQVFTDLQNYLETHKIKLQNRKGVLLNATMKRGYWWALLGVGAYSFFPYKVVWEAYGRKSFKPQIFDGHWQANQSLQAFMPVKTLAEAQRICIALSDKKVEDYLLSLKMEGTMNWAQPGKIKKLVVYGDEALNLF